MAEPVSPPRRQSPLSHRVAIAGDGARMAELPFLGKFILRAAPEEASARLAPLGFTLPRDPLQSSAAGEAALLWLGPDEWMLVTPPADAARTASDAAQALAGMHHQLVDVSDYYTAIDLSGAKARELLMKLTTLDLHPRAFKAGMVAGSLFGRANATLWQTLDDASDGGPTFRLFIRWSMADYVWCALADAGREWGVPEQQPVKGEPLTPQMG
jgi:heterotetrameric sarcosine oxidase gamma subunit